MLCVKRLLFLLLWLKNITFNWSVLLKNDWSLITRKRLIIYDSIINESKIRPFASVYFCQGWIKLSIGMPDYLLRVETDRSIHKINIREQRSKGFDSQLLYASKLKSGRLKRLFNIYYVKMIWWFDDGILLSDKLH